ncbi:hypothetical protein J2S41_000374 [Catenuloplanes atrovinosus]|uniref:Uncharacterized protein n=1 Tax=Catenuloplanes atrovinosus TaxID=137266 RepID=A0AAE4C6K3_9ACTN|nr:hypothetical protein [Catenuloplanes atrovinosus]
MGPELVGDTGFEPVTSSVSTRYRSWRELGVLLYVLVTTLVAVGLRWSAGADFARPSPGILPDAAQPASPRGTHPSLRASRRAGSAIPGPCPRPNSFVCLCGRGRSLLPPAEARFTVWLGVRVWYPIGCASGSSPGGHPRVPGSRGSAPAAGGVLRVVGPEALPAGGKVLRVAGCSYFQAGRPPTISCLARSPVMSSATVAGLRCVPRGSRVPAAARRSRRREAGGVARSHACGPLAGRLEDVQKVLTVC